MRARGTHPLARRAVNYVAAIAAISTSLLVYLALLSSAVRNQPTPVYLWTRAEASAAQWLGENSSGDDVVLASTSFANPLAGSIDGRLVQGHNVATFDNRAKEALVSSFFNPTTAAEERERILQVSGATVVALGPHERELGVTSLDGLP